jgi:exoribonuclease-2
MTAVRSDDLGDIARRAMLAYGLEPAFPAAALAEVDAIGGPAASTDPAIRDLRALPWASIDDDESRDLDQLTVAEERPGGVVRLRVAIADVDALVVRGSALDEHARHNTTSVYTAVRIFPMLPERLSTDLTSLAAHADRLAIVIEFDVATDGALSACDVYGARVRNQAKLAYDGVAAWLEDGAAMSPALAAVAGLDAQLRTQDRAAQALRGRRHEEGALELETIEPHTLVRDGRVVGLRQERKNRARLLIEDLMIAANGVTARYLSGRGLPALRRVVRVPERWDRIVALAAGLGTTLPAAPDAKALAAFLSAARQADPLRFPDLSLAVVKLMGAGEYVATAAGATSGGHFGLAARDYTHSTAPNRRYPDLVTQRLLKTALGTVGARAYELADLEEIAAHCTAQENAANKVERRVRKSAAALLLADRVGDRFDAIVTGVSKKGTWARLLEPPVEGRVVRGATGLDVGERVRVALVGVDVERGFIDFARA